MQEQTLTTTADNPRSLAYRIAKGINFFLGDPLRLDHPEPPSQPPSQQEEPEPKGTPSQLSVIRSEWDDFFELVQTRRARYQDYERMDTGDLAVMLDDIVDACTISDDGRLFGFRIEAGAKVKNLLEEVKRRTGMDFLIREALRNCLKYGDEFVAITVNNYGDIVYLQPLPVEQMLARVDKHNRLLRGTEEHNGKQWPAAYWQVDDMGQPMAAWYPWEMCHLKYAPTRKSPYSRTSLFEQVRGRWHKLRMIEEALVIARLYRAFPRFIHYIDVTGLTRQQREAFIKEYMDRVTKSKLAADPTTGSRSVETRRLSVDEDIFIGTGYITLDDGSVQPLQGRVEVIDPQVAGLRYIPDVEYMQRGLFLKVSGEIIGIPGEREDISQQDIASSRFYQWCQWGILEKQLLRPIFDLALRLKGYNPGEDAYKIIWPPVIIQTSWRFADATFRKSMADNNRIEAGLISRKRIAQDIFGFTDEEWEKVKQEIMDEMDTLGPIDRGSRTQQVRIGNRAT